MRTAGKQLKIVYTPLHGSGNKPVRRILREIGIENVYVVKEQELPDPNFSTIKVPNPEDPAAFAMAMKLADEVGADCIFGTDPDCDRVGIAVKDDKGEYYLMTGNQIGCVLLYYILMSRRALGTLPADGAVVKSVVSTELARRIAESFGLVCFDTLTGFKWIAEKIQQFCDRGDHTFVFGFEESYGFLSSTFVRDKDGVNASCSSRKRRHGPRRRGRRFTISCGDLSEIRLLCRKGGLRHPAGQGWSGQDEADYEKSA